MLEDTEEIIIPQTANPEFTYFKVDVYSLADPEKAPPVIAHDRYWLAHENKMQLMSCLEFHDQLYRVTPTKGWVRIKKTSLWWNVRSRIPELLESWFPQSLGCVIDEFAHEEQEAFVLTDPKYNPFTRESIINVNLPCEYLNCCVYKHFKRRVQEHMKSRFFLVANGPRIHKKRICAVKFKQITMVDFVVQPVTICLSFNDEDVLVKEGKRFFPEEILHPAVLIGGDAFMQCGALAEMKELRSKQLLMQTTLHA